MCKYEWARISLVKGGLYPKLQYYGICKFPWKIPIIVNLSMVAQSTVKPWCNIIFKRKKNINLHLHSNLLKVFFIVFIVKVSKNT